MSKCLQIRSAKPVKIKSIISLDSGSFMNTENDFEESSVENHITDESFSSKSKSSLLNFLSPVSTSRQTLPASSFSSLLCNDDVDTMNGMVNISRNFYS